MTGPATSLAMLRQQSDAATNLATRALCVLSLVALLLIPCGATGVALAYVFVSVGACLLAAAISYMVMSAGLR